LRETSYCSRTTSNLEHGWPDLPYGTSKSEGGTANQSKDLFLVTRFFAQKKRNFLVKIGKSQGCLVFRSCSALKTQMQRIHRFIKISNA